MLQEGEFDGIQEAFQQILDLGISGEQERLLMLEAWWVAESLGKAGQHDLAHQTIESSLRVLQDSQHLFNLKMLDGKLYKNQGLLSEAVQAYRSAQQFRQPEEQ
jgi:tetratricopeptide (TPR) repeat protein